LSRLKINTKYQILFTIYCSIPVGQGLACLFGGLGIASFAVPTMDRKMKSEILGCVLEMRKDSIWSLVFGI